MRIDIITTGGTIDKVYFDALSSFQVGDPQIGEVLRQAHTAFEFHIHTLMRKDSLELTDEDRSLILNTIKNCPGSRILITHGTDTMAQTGKFLQDLRDKTIVLTGSLNPVRFKESDAIFNIGFAVAAVQLLAPGVYLAMNGRVYDPNKVTKDRSQNRFIELAQ
ncbi:MAG: asparaginase domain-containing protein [Verrucomicrobia bacterium]|nr:asparaginase domain-containing protein [Verrucomicrobiota bacterium]